MQDPWGTRAVSKPTVTARRRLPRKMGHARTEGKGRTTPLLVDDAS
jgi:hypothetical protein